MNNKSTALKYERLYNSESKKRFIEKYESLDSKLTLYWQFLKVAPFEQTKGKDMSEMNNIEIKDLLLSIECSTITSAINHINTYKRYIELTDKTDTNPFNTFSSFSELASEVVANYKNKRYSKEDLMFMLDELNNYTDQALLLALFEGIKGKSFSELLTLRTSNLKVIDIDDGYRYEAKIYDEGNQDYRTIEISEDLYKLLILADKQEAYRTNNEDETVETPFNDSEFIFKKGKKGKQDGSVVLDRHFITRKFVFFKKFFGNTHLTADDIVQSGMMYKAYELFKKNNKIGKQELLIIGEQYDTIMASSNGKEEYRNITVLKRIVFTKELERLYTELKGIEYSD